MKFRPDVIGDASVASDLIERTGCEYVDLVPGQLRELFIIRNLPLLGDRSKATELPEYAAFSAGHESQLVFLHYPWLKKVFRSVCAEDFHALRTNRNLDLITASEQQMLRSFSVAIFGLSVGSNIAFTLSQAGIANRMVLADPDTLATSNLNRVMTGIQDIGMNKALLAARKISESNPFADVNPLDTAIDEEGLSRLLDGGELGCIVEEVDSLPTKIATRKAALRHRLPVVMVTDNGFGVVLHVERYDLGYDKIFGREAAYWDDALKGDLDIEAVSKLIVTDIIGNLNDVDPRLVASASRVFQRELVSWPQLGSTALLGAVVATRAISQIALHESQEPYVKRIIRMDS